MVTNESLQDVFSILVFENTNISKVLEKSSVYNISIMLS